MSLVVPQPKSRVAGAGSAAANEVYPLTATQFAVRTQMHQGLYAQAAAVRGVFTTTLAISAGWYADAEAANAIAAC